MATRASSESSSPSYPIPRRAHKKSKTGCLNCKERRVKCDEQRPVCRKCAIHYANIYECDYGDNNRKSRGPRSEAVAESSSSKLQTPSRQTRQGHLTLDLGYRNVSPSLLDPFKHYPPSNEPDIDMLLKAYLTTHIFNVFPYYPTRKLNPVLEFFAPLICKDPLLFNVTLLLSAYEIEKAIKPQERTRSKRLLKESVQLLHDRISEAFPYCVSDETISAVAGLAAIEHEKGNSRLVQTHTAGLRRMIAARGGLDEVRKSNSTVANIVFCLFVAAASDNFPIDSLEPETMRPQWYYESLSNEAIEDRIDFEAHGVLSEYSELMLNIRMLAKTYQTAENCSTTKQYQDVLTFLCSTMEKLLILPVPDPTTIYENRITAACRYALIVHVFAQWCGHQPDPSLLVSAAQHDLISVLRPLMADKISNKLILWLLSVGGTGIFAHTQRKWFVNQLADVSEDLGINTWPQMRESLRQVIWHEYQDERQHRELWDEVLKKRETRMAECEGED